MCEIKQVSASDSKKRYPWDTRELYSVVKAGE